MRGDLRTQRTPAPAPTARATTNLLPTSGFALIVDGQVKAEFKTQDQATEAATDLKRRFLMLQIKVYDAENKRSNLL